MVYEEKKIGEGERELMPSPFPCLLFSFSFPSCFMLLKPEIIRAGLS